MTLAALRAGNFSIHTISKLGGRILFRWKIISFISNTASVMCWYNFHVKILTGLCWGKLKAKGEGGGRGREGWMASLTQWA